MYTMKYPYLVNLSIITRIVLYTYLITRSLDFGNFIIKSYNITFYSLFGVSTSCSSLYGVYLLNLFLWQSGYSFITFLTKFYTFLIIYSSYNLNTNAIAPLYLCVSPLWNASINFSIMSLSIYIALSYTSYPL